MNNNTILSYLPYSSPFLFVDRILAVDSNSIIGEYTFGADLEFYKGHFADNPVTPGVILTECMAQIGLVCFGIYFLHFEKKDINNFKAVMSSSEIEYLKPVYPGEKVKVISEKEYFRFHKLKCRIRMENAQGDLVCRGVIAGMMLTK